jgi:glycine cleavage system H protein
MIKIAWLNNLCHFDPTMSEQINYMNYEWISIDDGVVTVGLTEEAVDDLSEEFVLNLPEQDDSVSAGKVCGDIESDNGNLNLYSPVSGTVLEVNESLLENLELLIEDPTDEGWLFKIEADDPEKLDKLTGKLAAYKSDEDDDDDDEDDEEDDEDGDDSDEPYSDDEDER